MKAKSIPDFITHIKSAGLYYKLITKQHTNDMLLGMLISMNMSDQHLSFTMRESPKLGDFSLPNCLFNKL